MDPCLKLVLTGDPEEVLLLLVRLHRPDAVPTHCTVVTQFGDIITCRVKRKHLLDVYHSPYTFSVKAPRLIPAALKEDIAEDGGQIIPMPSRHVDTEYTGKGVYFAAVDWGFDFAHKNLRKPDGTTRFSCIWDQNGIYDGNKYGYGCMYTEEEINDALHSETPYQTLGYHPGKTDFFGQGMHGTHVLDIAAGSRIVGEGGIAPGARFVGVQLGSNMVNGSDLALGDSVRLVEALDFIQAQTKDAPCVINMSLGSHGDSHTGRSLVEIAFDHFLSAHPGYALLQSVGNYYQAHCHIHHTLEQGQEYLIEWNIPHRNRAPNEVEIWYAGEDEMTLALTAPDGETVAEVHPFEDIRISYRGDPIGYIFHRTHEPNTGLNHIDIILDVTILTGKWIIAVTGKKIRNGSFHAYCERNDLSQAKFSPHQSSSYTTTGSVCNGRHTITVGAYNHKDPGRNVVAFSSAGPTLLGQPKPDLLAPGYKISAARSAPPTAYDATDGLTIKSGSSMAAPHVSGAIALLFEKYLPQRLPIAAVKELLQKAMDPLPDYYTDADRNRAGRGFLNTRKLVTDKSSIMPIPYYSGGSEEEPVEEILNAEASDESETEHVAGFEAEQDLFEDQLSSWYDNSGVDPFDLYRQFHPRYASRPLAMRISVLPVALPGKMRRNDLQPGDLVLKRNVLTNATYAGVVVEPQWTGRDSMNGLSHLYTKPGWYLKVYGNFNDNGNKITYVRAAGNNNRITDDLVILRNNEVANGSEAIDGYYESGDDYFTEDAVSVPPLLNTESDPPAETFYVGIDLGLRKECSLLDQKTYKCIKNLDFDVKAETGIFFPAAAMAKPAIDILLYLHGHKSGYVKSGKDLPISGLWNKKNISAFAFRELLHDSGRDLVLVAPTLGTLSQAGSLVTDKGFTQFIDQVLLSIAQYSSLYKGKAAPSIQSITLAAHSGGGIRMRGIANLAGTNAYANLIRECWGFDCTYTKDDPQVWHDWAAAHPDKTLYLYSIAGTGTARLADKLNEPALSLPNIHATHAATGEHNRVPIIHMNERLTGKPAGGGSNKSGKVSPPNAGTVTALKASVGKGGKNQADDVLKVQTLLNNAGIPIAVNGMVTDQEGDATVLAIFHYQKRKKLKYYDGKVDPNGSTIRSLLQQSGVQPAPPAPPSPVPTPPGPLPGPVTDPVLEAELLTHPALRSRYTTTAAYKKIRDEVAKWRTGKPPRGIADIPGYMEEALQQWNAHPEIHGHFNGKFDGDPHSSYLNLKRLYEAKGIVDPAAYFKSNIVSIKVFNHNISTHKDLGAALKVAEADLTAKGIPVNLNSAGSFVPRTVNFNINQLSDHAMGKAIDFNPGSNPHIRDQDEVKVINAVCKSILADGLLHTSDPDVLRNASTHFQNTFSSTWVQQQSSDLQAAAGRSIKRLNSFRQLGFLTLSTPFIRALQQAGLQWGGSWTSAKDFMHFQLPGA